MNKLKARIDAFNRFVVDAKAANVWDSIEAACIMAGWSNVAGALTPLKGAAPTNNGFIDSDLDAGIGLAGDGSSYVATGRGATEDSANDFHMSAFCAASDTSGYLVGARNTNATYNMIQGDGRFFNRGASYATGIDSFRFAGSSRSGANALDLRVDGNAFSSTAAALSNIDNREFYAFCINSTGTPASHTTARMSWYSIGSSVDLAALDTVVSQLAADLRAIDEDGFDPLALDYIRRVEAADGAYLETGVKQAINAFVVGCRKDGTLDALKASCILCGARTISGALVPLVGTAPTAQGGWASGDYDRATGMKGNGSSLYLDSNRANNADGLTDKHLSVYISDGASVNKAFIGSMMRVPSVSVSQVFYQSGVVTGNLDTAINTSTPYGGSASLAGVSRSGSNVSVRASGATVSQSAATSGEHSYNHHVFARNDADGSFPFRTDARLAFYSIGSSVDLSLLDNRVSTLISSIATALA